MDGNATTLEGGAVPFLRYGNLRRAISWLGTTLGFGAHVTVGDDRRDSGRGTSSAIPKTTYGVISL